jgi:hypothetical protein
VVVFKSNHLEVKTYKPKMEWLKKVSCIKGGDHFSHFLFTQGVPIEGIEAAFLRSFNTKAYIVISKLPSTLISIPSSLRDYRINCAVVRKFMGEWVNLSRFAGVSCKTTQLVPIPGIKI